MLNFFRRIRKSFFSENRSGTPSVPFGRYLKYATGEIILVVIGILIALGINNWNEDRKADNSEKIVLNNIAENLALDSVQFDYYTSQYRNIDNLHVELYKAGLSDERAEIISEPPVYKENTVFQATYWPGF